ncbi:PrgI family protein [Streptomyces sp. NPDC059009]|uniref:PrgI family protein n=1 Tax=Streptomyces sp. NPDC059009 TaxID=3346694 RepID=UPI0036CC2810
MTQSVRIPADVDREDTVFAGLTARQLLVLSLTGAVLYGGWSVTRAFLPSAVFLVVALPVGVGVAALVLGQRDGIALDRLTLAAFRQRLEPTHHVLAPEGICAPPAWLRHSTSDGAPSSGISPTPLRLPVAGVSETSVVDLAQDGLAVIALCGTVNFALRTPAEQNALVAVFGRYLHSLTAPVQILVRAERLDLSAPIAELQNRAPNLPHPALERAALEHADYLAELDHSAHLLRRQVLLVLREPLAPSGPVDGLGGATLRNTLIARRAATHRPRPVGDAQRRAAEARLMRRLDEAVDLLQPAGISVTPLDAQQTAAVLAAACQPDRRIPPHADYAGADEVITSAAHDEEARDSAAARSRRRATWL